MTDQRPQLDAQKHGSLLSRLFGSSTQRTSPAQGFRGHCLDRSGDICRTRKGDQR